MVVSAERLRQSVSGVVLTRRDPGYDVARRGWGLTVDQYPALILVPHDATDIVTGVRFAGDAGLGVAVQSTGHGVLYPADDSLLIVTSRMGSAQVDVQARNARVEAGARWQQVLDVATPYGLAPLLGSAAHLGVVGYVLGGGIGWLGRRYGFGCDSVRRIEIVTADGELRRTSDTEHGDLFWALRGGGGNFGVVTSVELELYPVAKLYGGSLAYPKESVPEALDLYRDWIRTVPDELTSAFAIVRFPDLEQVPEMFRGKTHALVTGAFAGNTAEGERWIQPWLDWQTPIDNTYREMPFSDVGTTTNDPVDPVAEFGSSDMFDELTDQAIDVIVHHATDSESPLTLNVLRHAAGAIARIPPDASAIANRDATLYLLMAGEVPNPDALANTKDYVQRYRTALQPHTKRGAWMNFMNGNGDGARERIGEAYPPDTLERLRKVKAKYDPDNMFRYSYQLGG